MTPLCHSTHTGPFTRIQLADLFVKRKKILDKTDTRNTETKKHCVHSDRFVFGCMIHTHARSPIDETHFVVQFDVFEINRVRDYHKI